MLTQNQIGNRIKWVAALLSGDYKQGRAALKTATKDGYTYCCLGVACELLDPTAWELNLSRGGTLAKGYMELERGQALLGITSIDQSQAANWNDIERYTFGRIADFVAWATEHETGFYDLDTGLSRVPERYAADWLRQLEQLNQR